jgi:hypothetical protein
LFKWITKPIVEKWSNNYYYTYGSYEYYINKNISISTSKLKHSTYKTNFNIRYLPKILNKNLILSFGYSKNYKSFEITYGVVT